MDKQKIREFLETQRLTERAVELGFDPEELSEEERRRSTPPPEMAEDLLAAINELSTAEAVTKMQSDIDANIELLEYRERALRAASDLEKLKMAWQSPRCAHVSMSGKPCGSPALREQTLCYYHARACAPHSELPVVEDRESFQLALKHLCDLVTNGRMEPPRAKLLLQVLQAAARTAEQ